MKKRFSGQAWRRIMATVAGLVLLTTPIACGGKPEKQAKRQEKAEDVNIVLNQYPNVVHAFLYEAIEKGYFTEEGPNIYMQFPSNESDATSLVSAGKVEFGLYYQQDITRMVVDQGVRVRSPDAVYQNPLNIVLSLKDKNILSSKGLEGRTVGHTGTPPPEAMVSVLMWKIGADMSALTLKNVSFSLMSSMTTGQVDATIDCLVNHGMPQLGKEGFSLSYLSPTEYDVPDYHELYLITSDNVLKGEPEFTEKFVHAVKKGFTDFKVGPDAVAKLPPEKQNAENFPLSENVEKKSAAVPLPKMESDSVPFLSQTESRQQRNIDWTKQRSPIQRVPELKEPLPAGGGNWGNRVAEGEWGGKVTRKQREHETREETIPIGTISFFGFVRDKATLQTKTQEARQFSADYIQFL